MAAGGGNNDPKDKLGQDLTDELLPEDDVSLDNSEEVQLPFVPLKCKKMYCKGFGTTFKYSSELLKHEK